MNKISKFKRWLAKHFFKEYTVHYTRRIDELMSENEQIRAERDNVFSKNETLLARLDASEYAYNLLSSEKKKTKSKSKDPRACIVEGQKALFHRWAEKAIPIAKIDAFLSAEDILKSKRRLDESLPVIPAGANIFMQKSTLAIVEFEDGTVKEVMPDKVQFGDNKVKEIWRI